MQTINTILNSPIFSNLILALLPFIIALASLLYTRFVQRLPEKQAAMLQKFSTEAVQFVEQVYKDMAGEQKKELATRIIIDLFHEFKLPVPGTTSIQSAIESCVFLLNHLESLEGEFSQLMSKRARASIVAHADLLDVNPLAIDAPDV